MIKNKTLNRLRKIIKESDGNYNDKMKVIRLFVDFDYDLRKNLDKELTPAQKRQISTYYNDLAPTLKNRNIKIYSPRNKNNLDEIQKTLGTNITKTKLKRIPIGLQKGENAKDFKIIKRKGKPIKIERFDFRLVIEHFNMDAIVFDPESELDRTIDNLPNNADRYGFMFHNNLHEGLLTKDKWFLKELYYNQVEKYQPNSLTGVAGIYFINQVKSKRKKKTKK